MFLARMSDSIHQITLLTSSALTCWPGLSATGSRLHQALGGDPFDGLLVDGDASDSDEEYTEDQHDSKRTIDHGALSTKGVEAAKRLTQEPVLSGLFNCRLFAAQ
jgi:hypothetical protein